MRGLAPGRLRVSPLTWIIHVYSREVTTHCAESDSSYVAQTSRLLMPVQARRLRYGESGLSHVAQTTRLLTSVQARRLRYLDRG